MNYLLFSRSMQDFLPVPWKSGFEHHQHLVWYSHYNIYSYITYTLCSKKVTPKFKSL